MRLSKEICCCLDLLKDLRNPLKTFFWFNFMTFQTAQKVEIVFFLMTRTSNFVNQNLHIQGYFDAFNSLKNWKKNSPVKESFFEKEIKFVTQEICGTANKTPVKHKMGLKESNVSNQALWSVRQRIACMRTSLWSNDFLL